MTPRRRRPDRGLHVSIHRRLGAAFARLTLPSKWRNGSDARTLELTRRLRLVQNAECTLRELWLRGALAEAERTGGVVGRAPW